MASYLLTFPTAHDGGDVVRIMDAMDTLAECATGNIEDRSDRIHRGQLREKESGVRV
jgi:hypothetical protein